MTRAETAQILDILRAAFPALYRGMSREELERALDLWSVMFVGDNVELVAAAVKALIATKGNGFPPTIGEVRARLSRLRDGEIMSEAEAWDLVRRAARNGYYNSRAEFARLPGLVQRAVGSPETLREWSQLDAETFEGVIGSHFRRTFRARAANERERLMVPADIRALLDDKRLPDGPKLEVSDEDRAAALRKLLE